MVLDVTTAGIPADPQVDSIKIKDNTTATYYLVLDSDSDGTALTADRTITFDVNNADRTIDLAGDLTVEAGGGILNQDLTTDASPTFASIHLVDNTTGAYELILDSDSDGTALTADRTLTFDVNNASRTIDLAGDLTIATQGGTIDFTGASKTLSIEDDATVNQDLSSDADVTFNDITISTPSNIYALSHNSFADYVANEHINWTGASSNLVTSGTLKTLLGSGDYSELSHNDTDGYLKWNAGVMHLQTQESNTDGKVYIEGNGTGEGQLRVYDDDGSTFMLIEDDLFDTNASSLIMRANGTISFRCGADVTSGNMFQFVPNSTAIELRDSDGQQAALYLEAEIQQTNTAAIDMLEVNLLNTSLGDGSTGDGNNLLRLEVDSATKYRIDTDGVPHNERSGEVIGPWTHQDDSIADDGTVNLPDATSGVVFVSCNAEAGFWLVQNDGSSTKVVGTANTAASDSDTDLCVYDGGSTQAIVKNRLGATGEIRIIYFYN